ncbi:hypothetical protein ABT369_39440 [Dactylosporangium sp. NPDC000244]|uniref:hypothetical protein n=1 Tax=Dactylosporangium sp. NPDC000244 TaxID=3154365 RepID=UPI003331DF13
MSLADVRRAHERHVDLVAKFDRAPNAASRAVVAENIAAAMRAEADNIDGSLLARALSFGTAERCRADAAQWDARAAECWAEAAKESDL